ncbi:MAG: M20/M25/M40 family metallo-hydrolase [Verrucomicrobia bacterium]|nr:M20/M25/M40 family metallo-hydrolase [Verrucomicrobiota bacterium]
MRKGSVNARPREAALSHREKLRHLREILFANVVMAGEIPAPSGGERRITRFLSDRFTESGLANISLDHAGNVAGVLPGRGGARHLLVSAHVDKIWAETDDHTVSVGVGRMSGRGIADNSLGVAVLATLPLILDELGVELDSNLILLGTTRSFGRGDLGGMRFFLGNSERPVDAALCLEGIELGRLSYSSLGMARGEIEVSVKGPSTDGSGEDSGVRVVAVLTGLVGRLLAIHEREHPRASVLVRSIETGSGDGVPPRGGRIRFEIRSHEAVRVARVEEEIAALVAGADRSGVVEVRGEMIARRSPGDLGADHPLVAKAREILGLLGIETHVAPSVSELALLLERGIPSLTLGITRGENRHSSAESIRLEPIFDGLAQIVALLQFMDDSGNY